MSAAQIENLIVQKSKGLPADVLQEIVDFIDFLKFKKTATTDSIGSTLSDLTIAEAGHLEEEFRNYKSMYPHE